MRRDKGPRLEYDGAKERALNNTELRNALHDRVNIDCLLILHERQN